METIKCSGECGNQTPVTRVFKFKGSDYCNGCYENKQKQAIAEWDSHLKMKLREQREFNVARLPRLSDYIN